MADEAYVCVGDRLGSTAEHAPGPGTFARNGFIHASIIGVRLEQPAAAAAADDGGAGPAGPAKPVLSVVSRASQPAVPEPGMLVTAKVTQVTPAGAHCRILVAGARALDAEFKGVIRQQDARAALGGGGGGGADSSSGGAGAAALFDAFRPGDVVRAAVLSLGDARSYFLTTAANELGVVHATSLAGNAMVPVSWEAMVDPVTRCQEKRKVARVAGAVPAAS